MQEFSFLWRHLPYDQSFLLKDWFSNISIISTEFVNDGRASEALGKENKNYYVNTSQNKAMAKSPVYLNWKNGWIFMKTILLKFYKGLKTE